MSSHHVFVVTLSVFPRKLELPYTKYVYEDYSNDKIDNTINPDKNNKKNHFECYGYYQLSPIPKFIKDYLGTDITDVILLETEETKNNHVDIKLKEWDSKLGDEPIEWELGTQNVTPAEYYNEYLKELFHNQDLKFHEILVDPKEDNTDGKEPYGLTDTAKQLFKTIEDLYKYQDNTNNWRLWFDTHGGFRDLNMVVASTARLLAIQEGKTVITNGIYSVYHSQDTGTDYIKDQTAFYFADSIKSLAKFLAYGQYIARSFTPYVGKDPYCFVSYRHDINYLNNVRNLFHLFEENNIKYWFDQDIRDGEKWDEKLRDKNENATVFILLYTNSYLLSPECWKELIRFMIITKNNFNKEVKKGKMSKNKLKDYYQKHIKIISFEKDMNFPKDFSISSIKDPTKYSKDFEEADFRKRLNKIIKEEKKHAKKKELKVKIDERDIQMVFSTEIQKICFWKFLNNSSEISERTPEDKQIRKEIKNIKKLLKAK